MDEEELAKTVAQNMTNVCYGGQLTLAHNMQTNPASVREFIQDNLPDWIVMIHQENAIEPRDYNLVALTDTITEHLRVALHINLE